MKITVIQGKPTLEKNNFTLGTFPSKEQAQQAAERIEPLLTGKIEDIKEVVKVIKQNGGK